MTWFAKQTEARYGSANFSENNAAASVLCGGILISVADIRKQGAAAGALNRYGKLTLMLCAGAGDTAPNYLGALADKLAETRDVLVIDIVDLVDAELALLLAVAVEAGTVRGTLLSLGSLPGFRRSGSRSFGGLGYVLVVIFVFV